MKHPLQIITILIGLFILSGTLRAVELAESFTFKLGDSKSKVYQILQKEAVDFETDTTKSLWTFMFVKKPKLIPAFSKDVTPHYYVSFDSTDGLISIGMLYQLEYENPTSKQVDYFFSNFAHRLQALLKKYSKYPFTRQDGSVLEWGYSSTDYVYIFEQRFSVEENIDKYNMVSIRAYSRKTWDKWYED